MTDKEIDLERVVRDPVYRRQVIDELNAVQQSPAEASPKAPTT